MLCSQAGLDSSASLITYQLCDVVLVTNLSEPVSSFVHGDCFYECCHLTGCLGGLNYLMHIRNLERLIMTTSAGYFYYCNHYVC